MSGTTPIRSTLRVALAAALVAAASLTPALAETTAPPAEAPSSTVSATANPTEAAAATSSDTPSSAAPTGSASDSGSAAPSSTTQSSAASGSAAPTSPAAKAPRAASAAPFLPSAGGPAAAIAAGANFVATTLAAGGDHYVYPGGSFLDGGNTIDGMLALAGANAGTTQAQKTLTYFTAHAEDYLGSAWGQYSGSIAKTIIGVDALGGDPTAFATHDLVTELKALEKSDGHFADTPTDYSITITQALSIIALLRTEGSTSAASTDFLVAQQCADGGFRGTLGKDPCVSDPDATGFAVQALAGARGASDPAAQMGADYLAGKQVGGGVGSSDGTLNANTTGVAAQAFAATGRTAALASAQAFLVTLQYGCSAPPALRGGFAFSTAARTTGSAPTDQDLRATPQALLGLTGTSLLTVTSAGDAAATVAMPCVTPTTTTPAPTSSPAVTVTNPPATATHSTPGASTPATSGDGLAFTGVTTAPIVLLGLLLLLVGSGAVVLSRRTARR